MNRYQVSDDGTPECVPTPISPEAREMAVKEQQLTYPSGHFVQQLLDAQKTISKKRIDWLERKFLPCPDCRDKVKEGFCLRCANQRLEQQLTSLRVIAEDYECLFTEKLTAGKVDKVRQQYKNWLTLNPETKLV